MEARKVRQTNKIRELRDADETTLILTTVEGLENLSNATKEHSKNKN